MAQKDYYSILKIPQKSSLKDIKSAYRQLALKYHPDHNPGNRKAAAMFAKVKEAYEVLSDPSLRKKFDATYKGPSPSEPKARAHEPTPDTSAGRKKKGKNLRYNLYITLEEVATGCEKGIRYIRKNKGENETVQLKVKVPVGAFQHQRLKLVNFGDVNKEGTGDLFVIVHLQEHPIFLKNDIDLRVNVPVTYLDVLLGSMIEIPTLKGVRKLKLKACDFDNLQFEMKGFGLPDTKNHLKGDLTVNCFIEHPSKLTTQEKNAAQKLLKTWPQGELMRQYQSDLKNKKGS